MVNCCAGVNGWGAGDCAGAWATCTGVASWYGGAAAIGTAELVASTTVKGPKFARAIPGGDDSWPTTWPHASDVSKVNVLNMTTSGKQEGSRDRRSVSVSRPGGERIGRGGPSCLGGYFERLCPTDRFC